MNYREVLAWLYRTQTFGIKLGLENIERLLRELHLGHMLGAAPLERRGGQTVEHSSKPGPLGDRTPLHGRAPLVIHVAGTNGKGSVCAMADAICCAAGRRTGLFTSPHLVSFRERIRVNGEMIAEEAVAAGLTRIRTLVADWETHPTFFEIVTALAIEHFDQNQCEIVVLETGMGGRLDATNAVASDVAVITPIDFDHQKWLGHSLAEIAAEKAGIIKPHSPVVSAPQLAEAEAVICARAKECNAPLQVVRESWTASPITLPGEHQKENAAVAAAALGAANLAMRESALARGLASVEWPARFQLWDQQIVIDGAHNPGGIESLVRTWRAMFGAEKATVVLAILQDKDAATMICQLRCIASRFVLPAIRSERAISPRELTAILGQDASTIESSIARSTADAIIAVRQNPERVLITGSLHFAGEALAFLQGQPEALEDCAQ